MDPRQRLQELATRAAELRTQLQNTQPDAENFDALLADAEQVAADHTRTAAEVAALDAAEVQRTARAEAARAALASVSGGSAAPVARSSTAVLDREPEPQQRLGQRFTADPRFRDYAQRQFIGQIAVDFPDTDIRTLVTGTTKPGAAKNPYVGSVEPNPVRQLVVADLIDRQNTNMNSVPYIIETDGGAGALEVSEGAAKPEVTITYTEADSPMRTIAGWIPITRQAAEDDATLLGYIEGRLGFKVEYRLDAEILSGDGVAPNLRGILNTTGIGTYAPVAAEARLISLRKAITLAQIAEYQPDAVMLHPTDLQILSLDVDTQGRFRVTPDVQAGPSAQMIWGLRIVATTAMASGTALVGAFRLGATLWERHGVRLLMTDSHASNFTSNILVLLAEMRAALTVWRPAAFVKITFNGTT